MYKSLIGIAIMLFGSSFYGQTLNGKQLLDKAIAYHDANSNWASFNAAFNVSMKTPGNAERDSNIKINLPDDYFYLKANRDTITTEYTVVKDTCMIRLNGLSEIPKASIEKLKLNCDRAKLYKNYYTYLYGLPMKLKDPGTIIHDTVAHKTFKGKDYLVLKVSYQEGIGSDVWYFYFNPTTFAMEVYQFYKTDENGQLKQDSGEYILLTEELVISGIKMPKIRAWYYNKDNTYLGTDILE